MRKRICVSFHVLIQHFLESRVRHSKYIHTEGHHGSRLPSRKNGSAEIPAKTEHLEEACYKTRELLRNKSPQKKFNFSPTSYNTKNISS
jgi:hypothetical protein